MNTLKEKVLKLLDDSGVRYDLIPLPHELPSDIESHMQFHGKPVGCALANIVLATEKGLVVMQRRGDTELDNEKVRALLHVQQVRFANQEELSTLGLQPGLVPPLGYDVPLYIDKKVLEHSQIYTGTGEKSLDIKLDPNDLIKVTHASVVDVTQDQTEGRKRVYSGIRATGRLHLGNYLGAVKGMLALQDEYDCVFSVVDLHAITTPYDPKTLQTHVREVVLDFLAAGLDPQKCLIEIQSKVPQHMELAYYLSTIYPVSRLEDLPTYKDKKAQHPKYVNMGLLYYPVLMAADVLLYKGELVPVGIDQEPHLEVMREIARKFNSMFGSTFPEPQRFKTPGEYVPSLAGTGKMSKSVEGSYINLTDSFAEIQAKLAKAPTDSGTLGGEVPQEGGVANLFTLLRLFTGQEVYAEFAKAYQEKTIRYGVLKQTLAEAIYHELKPIQDRREEFAQDTKAIDRILEESNTACRTRSEVTMQEVRAKMGLS